jgi:hypothetical protein
MRPNIGYGLRLTLDKMSDVELAAITEDLSIMFMEAAAEIERQTGTGFVAHIRDAAEKSPRFKRDLLGMLEPRPSTQKFMSELHAEVDAAWRRLWAAQDEVARLVGPAAAAWPAPASVSIYSEGIAPRNEARNAAMPSATVRGNSEGAMAPPIGLDLAYARVNMVIAKGELHAFAEPTGECRSRDVRAAYERARRIEVLASTLEWIASLPAWPARDANGDRPLSAKPKRLRSGPIGHDQGAGGEAIGAIEG